MVRAREQIIALLELADVAGVAVSQINEEPPPRSSNHECGTARMDRELST